MPSEREIGISNRISLEGSGLISANEMKGCLVTGAAGFVGSHLVEKLLSLGHTVVGIDNFFSGLRENMASFWNDAAFTFYERSITEINLLSSLKALHPQLSYCFHLAAIVSVPHSLKNPEETMAVNYNSTIGLLNESSKMNFQSFVFAGSAAEYGDDSRLPLMEYYANEDTEHLSPYGKSKYLASKEVAQYPNGVALRCFNIYGPRQDPRSPYSGVISCFVDLALNRKPITIFGNGDQTRDFIYVSDVVRAYLLAAGLIGKNPSRLKGIYNIGSGESTSILELAGIVQDLYGSSLPPSFLPERPGDIRHSLASADALEGVTGWRPRVPLKRGLKETIRWASEKY